MIKVPKVNYFEEVNNLFITIYLIGYKDEGESILFTLSSSNPTNKLLYIGVIDSYSLNNKNITIELIEQILAEYDSEKRKLDFLCWTHPHDDHTKGMVNILKKFSDKNTLITLPSIFYMTDKMSNEAKDVIEYIKKMNRRKRVENRSNLEFLNGEGILHEVEIGRGRKYNMTLEYFGPYPNISSIQEAIDWNKFSTSIMLTINGIKVYLAGDIENMSIKSISEFPDRINYIKIPHHTSPTSSGIVKLLNKVDLTEIACTTVYNNKLPNKKLLSEYIHIVKDVFTTSKRIIDTNIKDNSSKFNQDSKVNSSLNNDEFGVVKVEIDVINGIYNTYLAGDAACVIC